MAAISGAIPMKKILSKLFGLHRLITAEQAALIADALKAQVTANKQMVEMIRAHREQINAQFDLLTQAFKMLYGKTNQIEKRINDLEVPKWQ